MIKKSLLVILVLYGAKTRHLNSTDKLIVWDVGQGQWISLITPKECFHYDMGGEIFPKPVLSLCQKKNNRLALSHWDYDHTSFVFKFKRQVLSFCVFHLPIGEHFLKRRLEPLVTCSPLQSEEVITPHKISKKENENSSIFFVKERKILITGDAPQKQERKLKSLGKVEVLVVGHHGSVTSSALEFLSRLKNLKVGLVSARQAKYGHPHQKVMSRFKKLKIPLLSTNDWGTLIYMGL